MDILDVAQYAAALTTIAAAFGLAVKWIIVKPIKAYIDTATYPIQNHANGGKSLPDAIATLNRIELRVGEIDDRLVAVENHVTKPATRSKKTTN